MLTDPLFYLVAVPAVLLSGISKGGFGSGLGTLATPLLALLMPTPQAAGIMLPILCAMDLFGLRAWRCSISWLQIRLCLPGALLGIVMGALTFRLLSEGGLRILLGLVSLVFPILQWRRESGPARGFAAEPGALSGAICGALSGFTSFIAHAGGPPLLIHLLRAGLDKGAFVGTTVLFFFVVNLVKLPFYAALGQLAPGNLLASLVLLPLAPLGISLGVYLHGRISERWFFRVVYVGMMLVGVRLIQEGLGRVME